MQETSSYDTYASPFSTRYVSPDMSRLFSQHFKISTFRRLWLALAKAQKQLGLPITSDQIEQMEKHIETIDFEKAGRYEKEFRHDVMAHIHTFGDECPLAKPILHLGATSSYVTDNGDLIQMKEALKLLHTKLLFILESLAKLAKKHANDPTLSYTHYQSAQPTTIGKRICLWLQDFYHDALDWERLETSLPFLGVKGAVGTQASFLALFEGDAAKVKKLESLVASSFGFSHTIPISGQTYSRKIDLSVLNALASFAASAHKMATDLRLLAHEGELQEFFEEKQVGSSAMPHKRNPIYAERICGLARFVISLAQNPAYTAGVQWLERSLDDSSNRRLCIPEAFLGVDALLNLLAHILSHLYIDAPLAKEHLLEQLPLLSLENILMAAVKKGRGRQEMHETLRRLSSSLKKEKNPESLLSQELSDLFSEQEIKSFFNLEKLIGLAPSQVKHFLQEEIEPYLAKHPGEKASFSSVDV